MTREEKVAAIRQMSIDELLRNLEGEAMAAVDQKYWWSDEGRENRALLREEIKRRANS